MLVPAAHPSSVVEVAVVVSVDLQDPSPPSPLQLYDAVRVVVELNGVLVKGPDHINAAVLVGVLSNDRAQVVAVAVDVAVLGGVPDPRGVVYGHPALGGTVVIGVNPQYQPSVREVRGEHRAYALVDHPLLAVQDHSAL